MFQHIIAPWIFFFGYLIIAFISLGFMEVNAKSVKNSKKIMDDLKEKWVKIYFEEGVWNEHTVKIQARIEIEHENFRKAVEAEKTRIRNKKKWHNLVPFKIVRR